MTLPLLFRCATFLRHNASIVLALLLLLYCVLMQPRDMQRPAYRFQVTFDISQSMHVSDRAVRDKRVSRLAFAQESAAQLLRQLPCGSSVGWSIFTGRRVLSLTVPVEVCQHYEGLLKALEMIDGQMRWADASGIGKGLHQSIRAVHEMNDNTRVVFMTDGHEAPPLRAGSRGMPKSDDYPVSGVIVGIGGSVPARIPKLDERGRVSGYWSAEEVVQRSDDISPNSREELSSRRDVHLSKLSRLSGLYYVAPDSPQQLVTELLAARHALPQRVAVDLRWLPALLALLLLLWRFRPSWRRW